MDFWYPHPNQDLSDGEEISDDEEEIVQQVDWLENRISNKVEDEELTKMEKMEE